MLTPLRNGARPQFSPKVMEIGALTLFDTQAPAAKEEVGSIVGSIERNYLFSKVSEWFSAQFGILIFLLFGLNDLCSRVVSILYFNISDCFLQIFKTSSITALSVCIKLQNKNLFFYSLHQKRMQLQKIRGIMYFYPTMRYGICGTKPKGNWE